MTASHEVFQRDADGLWQIGLGDDAPGPFETRAFAQAVAGYPPAMPAVPLKPIFFKIKKEGRLAALSSV